MYDYFNLLLSDLKREWRCRQQLPSLIVFGMLMLFIFHFAFNPDSPQMHALIPGILWITVLLSALIHLNRTSGEPRRSLEGILLTPVAREWIYLAKVTTTALYIFAMEAVVVPFFMVMFPWNMIGGYPYLGGILGLGSIGMAAVGVSFSSMAESIKTREMLLPLLVFPILVPILLAGVRASEIILMGTLPLDSVWPWIKLMGAFDIIFLTAGALSFEVLVKK